MVAGPVDPRLAAMMQMVREMRKHVEENAEYVGDRFAEEARKIHYEEAEHRGIYGEASPDEAKALIEEGIAVHPCRGCRKTGTEAGVRSSHPRPI